jgi:hypothetical protein
MTDESVKPVITVRNFIDGAKLRADVTYSLTDLSSAMMTQAALRAHYGELKAAAQRQVNDFELLLEVSESRVYRRLRDEYAEKKEKSSDASLKVEVAGHERILAIRKAINEAKQVLDVAKGAWEAFSDRNDMLIQLGARDRTELQGELRIRAAEASSSAAGDRALAAVKKVRGES